MVVIRAWESPINGDSESFHVGEYGRGIRWTVGHIDYNSMWVLIHDDHGVLRVRMPLNTTAIEYGHAH